MSTAATKPFVGPIVLCDRLKWKFRSRRIDLLGVPTGPIRATRLPFRMPRILYFTFAGVPKEVDYRIELRHLGREGYEDLAWWTGHLEILDRSGHALFNLDLWKDTGGKRSRQKPILLEEYGLYTLEVSFDGERMGEVTFEVAPR